MGLFKNKKSKDMTVEEAAELEQHFFDENFREELRNHGRLYFEKVISDNGALFKQDLDETIAKINDDLKDHVTQQLDVTISAVNDHVKDYVTKQLEERFAQYGNEMREAQSATLESLKLTAEELHQQHKQLSDSIRTSIEGQDAAMSAASQENLDRMAAMKTAQSTALDLLNKSVQTLQEQAQQLRTMLQKNIVDQESMLMTAFQDNMAHIIEHYLLGALGDQFDLKAQLPSIIKQMEDNKQAMTDDMKL
jgi:exonuclease VII large subunit